MGDQLPLFKFIALICRQASAPIAREIKTLAKTHPLFSRTICMPTARLYHKCEMKYKFWMLNLGWNTKIAPLTDKQAIELGGDILGEIILFGFGSLIIIFEVVRQAKLQENKMAEKKSQGVMVKLSLEELKTELAIQKTEMDDLIIVMNDYLEKKPPPPSEQNKEEAARKAKLADKKKK